ncbi:MAG: PAS domain S-box protein [Acidobacteriota bacterium]|nr:PAS domain S-box protein [Acidobacteriota bacterium]
MSSKREMGNDGRREAGWSEMRKLELENSNQLLLAELTELRRSEAALRSMATAFEELMESNVIGIMFALADGTITDANDSFLRALGYSREDLSEGRVRWQIILPSGGALDECLESSVYGPVELQFSRKNGSTVKLLFAAESVEGRPQTIGFTQTPPALKSIG